MDTQLLPRGMRARGPAPMKPSALRIERMLEKIEAKLVPPERKCLCAIIHEGDDEAEAKEKALAEHVARHPEDVGRTVADFTWILSVVLKWPANPGGYQTLAVISSQ